MEGGAKQPPVLEDVAEVKAKRRPRSPVLASQRRVTMTDVAVEAGCSQATVSFVLNNSQGVKISAETRSRVIDAAIRLSYAPPNFAHLALTGGSQTPPDSQAPLGFLVDQLATSPEAVVAIDGARQAAWDDGRVVIAAQTTNDLEMERQAIRVLTAQPLSGLICMTIFTRRIELSPAVLRVGVPVVLLNCYDAQRRFPAVLPAEVAGGRRAVQHLIDLGHRRIGMITGEPWMEAARDRQKGYRLALAAAGLPIEPELICKGNWSASSGYDGVRRLLSLPKPPTAIFCQNDRMAIGAYEALKEAGIRIPNDISIVGYDDEEISRHLHPRLTTVILPHRAMGAWAARRLSATTDGVLSPHQKPQLVELECTMVERHSTGPPP